MGTWYLLGAVAGALLFGYLTDRLGRKKLFRVTLAVYLVFTVASGLAWNYWTLRCSGSLPGPIVAAIGKTQSRCTGCSFRAGFANNGQNAREAGAIWETCRLKKGRPRPAAF